MLGGRVGTGMEGGKPGGDAGDGNCGGEDGRGGGLAGNSNGIILNVDINGEVVDGI